MFCSVSSKHTLCYIIKLRVWLVTRLTANCIQLYQDKVEKKKTLVFSRRKSEREGPNVFGCFVD